MPLICMHYTHNYTCTHIVLLKFSTVGFLTIHELYNKLNDGVINPYIHNPNYMLLLDVRPENVYLQNHILIAKQWKTVKSSVKWLLNASGYLTEFTFIVIYDEMSTKDNLSEGTLMFSCLFSYIDPTYIRYNQHFFIIGMPWLC